MDLPADYTKMHWTERRLVRNQYVELQEGKCQHCGADLSGPPTTEVDRLKVNRKLFPKSFFKYPVHLHHCHKTGMTIGAVHNKCNAVLWQYFGR